MITSVMENDFDILSIEKLETICNPFKISIWGTKYPVSYKEIEKAIKINYTFPTPYSSFLDPPRWSKNKHIGRIAYLVLNPDLTPIEIDLGIPTLGYSPEWVVVDGNHRLAAAIFRGDKTINATCSGEVDLIKELIYKI
jgi:hypothetical protein